MVYIGKNKMSDLMMKEPSILFLINRFGVPFGIGDQSIEEVCRARGIDTDTFLAIINYQVYHQIVDVSKIDIPTLRRYLSNAHQYYVQYRLPYLRRTLIEAMPSEDDHQVVMLILRYFDSFVELIRKHIRQEESGNVKTHEKDDEHIAHKLSELTNLIIKYYPQDHSDEFSPLLVHALNSLRQTETEIMVHCEIEDRILVPAIEKQLKDEDKNDNGEVLSERENDVLIELVKGYSNKEIADHLCLSVHTVISHRKNIVRKLGIRSVAGLTIYAVVNNLVKV